MLEVGKLKVKTHSSCRTVCWSNLDTKCSHYSATLPSTSRRLSYAHTAKKHQWNMVHANNRKMWNPRHTQLLFFKRPAKKKKKTLPKLALVEENKTLFEAILWFPALHETGVVLGSAWSNRSHTKFHTTDAVTRQEATQTESGWHHKLVRIRFCCKTTFHYCLLREWNVSGSLNLIALVIVISSSININNKHHVIQKSAADFCVWSFESCPPQLIHWDVSITSLDHPCDFRLLFFNHPASILRSSSSFCCFRFCFSFLPQSSFCLKSLLLLLLHLPSFRFCLGFFAIYSTFSSPNIFFFSSSASLCSSC